jgi:hypothetical protein
VSGPAGRRGGLGQADGRGDKAEKDHQHAREPRGGQGKAKPGKAKDKDRRG